jgi:hypothetical protein
MKVRCSPKTLFLFLKKPAQCNILKNTPLLSKCHHDNLKSYSKIILCKMCKLSYNCLPINQKYFMTFSTKNYYCHRPCICIKKPLSLKKLQNPTRNDFFRWPHHIFVLVTVGNKELGIVSEVT